MSEARRCGRLYVSVPRSFVAKYQHQPFSVMLAASQSGVDGIAQVVDPGFDREIEKDEDDGKGGFVKVTKKIFVEEFPCRVKNASVFRPAGKKDGFDREDVAMLHSQNW